MRLLDLVIKMLELGRCKLFRSKQAPNKVPLLFLDVKMLEKTFHRRFQTLCMRGVVRSVIARSKVRLMYLEALKKEEKFHLRFWKLNHERYD